MYIEGALGHFCDSVLSGVIYIAVLPSPTAASKLHP